MSTSTNHQSACTCQSTKGGGALAILLSDSLRFSRFRPDYSLTCGFKDQTNFVLNRRTGTRGVALKRSIRGVGCLAAWRNTCKNNCSAINIIHPPTWQTRTSLFLEPFPSCLHQQKWILCHKNFLFLDAWVRGFPALACLKHVLVVVVYCQNLKTLFSIQWAGTQQKLHVWHFETTSQLLDFFILCLCVKSQRILLKRNDFTEVMKCSWLSVKCKISHSNIATCWLLRFIIKLVMPFSLNSSSNRFIVVKLKVVSGWMTSGSTYRQRGGTTNWFSQ